MNKSLPVLKPIQIQFRTHQKFLCRPAIFVSQPTVVTPEPILEKSSTQVAVLVGPKPCGLKPKGSTKKKRPSPLSIRASEEQKKILQEKAKAVAIPLGRYVLAAALGFDYRPPANPELTKALLMLSRELTAQGNNLNQVAKHVNMGKASPDECDGMLGILGRSMLQTHRAVRKALNEEPMP